MLAKGWSQNDLARASGLSPETVRPFTTGKPAVRKPATAAKIALALGQPGDAITHILDGHGPAAPPDLTDRVSRLEGRVDEVHRLVLQLLDTFEGDDEAGG